MIGNFMGDFVKGKQMNAFPSEIRKGILLHREIDTFTDSHPIVIKSKQRLRPKYRHYAPVIVDIFYDHFLSSSWSQYSNQDLLTFTQHFYNLTAKYDHIFPEKCRHVLKYMIPGNWLYHYQHLEGIASTLQGMSRRTKFDSQMEMAIVDLKANYLDFETEFHAFFPELKRH